MQAASFAPTHQCSSKTECNPIQTPGACYEAKPCTASVGAQAEPEFVSTQPVDQPQLGKQTVPPSTDKQRCDLSRVHAEFRAKPAKRAAENRSSADAGATPSRAAASGERANDFRCRLAAQPYGGRAVCKPPAAAASTTGAAQPVSGDAATEHEGNVRHQQTAAAVQLPIASGGHAVQVQHNGRSARSVRQQQAVQRQLQAREQARQRGARKRLLGFVFK